MLVKTHSLLAIEGISTRTWMVFDMRVSVRATWSSGWCCCRWNSCGPRIAGQISRRKKKPAIDACATCQRIRLKSTGETRLSCFLVARELARHRLRGVSSRHIVVACHLAQHVEEGAQLARNAVHAVHDGGPDHAWH